MANRALAADPNFRGSRSKGVKLAWKYEKADIEMGGKGSANWNENQRQEILENGKVRGAEGHHQRNVADHPEDQADPNNIKYYKSREEHLQEGHGGDFKNESDARNMFFTLVYCPQSETCIAQNVAGSGQEHPFFNYAVDHRWVRLVNRKRIWFIPEYFGPNFDVAQNDRKIVIYNSQFAVLFEYKDSNFQAFLKDSQ